MGRQAAVSEGYVAPSLEVERGKVAIAVIDGAMTYTAQVPYDRVEGVMDSFEKLWGASETDRYDQFRQGSLRVKVAEMLRRPDGIQRFAEVLGAACLWLALRHWSNGEDMRNVLARQVEEQGSAIVTCAIGAHEGALKDTAWSFAIGTRVHDTRAQLEAMPAMAVRLVS